MSGTRKARVHRSQGSHFADTENGSVVPPRWQDWLIHWISLPAICANVLRYVVGRNDVINGRLRHNVLLQQKGRELCFFLTTCEYEQRIFTERHENIIFSSILHFPEIFSVKIFFSLRFECLSGIRAHLTFL